jgi:pimeloyl-ACP methyl ester carboxylesterase
MLVFLHGYGCSSRDWTPAASELSADRECILLDLPGHGTSSCPAPATFDDLVAQVESKLTASCPQAPIIVGHSLGGMVGLALAARSGLRLQRLVLLDAFPYLPAAAEVLGGPEDESDPFGYGSVMDRQTPPAVQERIRRSMAAGVPRAGKPLFHSLLAADLRPSLPQITTPVSLIVGDRRHLTPALLPRYLHRLGYSALPGLQTSLAPSHHFIMLECPGLVAEHIRTLAGPPAKGNSNDQER